MLSYKGSFEYAPSHAHMTISQISKKSEKNAEFGKKERDKKAEKTPAPDNNEEKKGKKQENK